jgi:hypothetical protein
LAYKKMWNVAQIIIHSFCSYRSSSQGEAEPPHRQSSGSQRTRTPEEPFLHRINTRQEIGMSPRACHHCNPERLFGLRMLVGTPILGPERDPVPEVSSPNDMPLQGPFRLEKCQH